MPPSTTRHALLRKRLERFTRLLHGLDQGDIVTVHRTRVASRRLRELLPVLQLEPDVTRKLGRRLRKVTERLGTVRELDVLLMLIDELRESRPQETVGLRRVADAVGWERTEARDRLLERKLPLTDLKQIGRKLERIVETLERDDRQPASRRPRKRGWLWALDARIAHRAAALDAAMREAGAVYLEERLHTVRIALKKLRYAMELRAEAAGSKRTPDLRILKRDQDLLGRLHDLQVLIARVRQMQAALTPPNLAVWRELDAVVVSLENGCRRLHACYMRERPKLAAICARASGRPPSPAMRRAVV